MAEISAEELKAKGIEIIEDALLKKAENAVFLQGKTRFVVITNARYNELRECELVAALADPKEEA